MTATTDEPTTAQVLTMLEDDVVPLLDSASGALYTRRDQLLDRDSDEGESLATAADLLAQAWANARRAIEVVRADVPDDTPALRWTVRRNGPENYPWLIRCGAAIVGMRRTHAEALAGAWANVAQWTLPAQCARTSA